MSSESLNKIQPSIDGDEQMTLNIKGYDDLSVYDETMDDSQLQEILGYITYAILRVEVANNNNIYIMDFVLPENPVMLVCPITRLLFKNPVVDEDGHTFQKQAIERALAMKRICPLSGIRISKNLSPNILIRNEAEQHRVKIRQSIQQLFNRAKELISRAQELKSLIDENYQFCQCSQLKQRAIELQTKLDNQGKQILEIQNKMDKEITQNANEIKRLQQGIDMSNRQLNRLKQANDKLNLIINNRDQKIKSLQQLVSEKNMKMQELEQQMNERDQKVRRFISDYFGQQKVQLPKTISKKKIGTQATNRFNVSHSILHKQ